MLLIWPALLKKGNLQMLLPKCIANFQLRFSCVTSGCSDLTGIWGWHLQSTVYSFACVTSATFDPPSQSAVLRSGKGCHPRNWETAPLQRCCCTTRVLEQEMATLNARSRKSLTEKLALLPPSPVLSGCEVQLYWSCYQRLSRKKY